MKEQTTPGTTFLNVQVTAIPRLDAGKVRYDTTFNPPSLTVRDQDTVINYQLIDPTPAGVKFTKMTVKPDQNDQFSAPTISESGKLVTFSDANTEKASFNITLHFKDNDQNVFLIDPEVNNDPTRGADTPMVMAYLDPETNNDPTR